MSAIILPGADDSLPEVSIDVVARPAGPDDWVNLVALKIGSGDGYTATDLRPEQAMGVCAALVDQCRALGVDVVHELLSWCLAVHAAPGVDIETATRKVEGRLLDAAVTMAGGR